MDCRSVMRVIETQLFEDEPLAQAIEFMVSHHDGYVPVVSRDGSFVGLLGEDRLMNALLPHSLTMMRGFRRAGYLREDRSELMERLDELHHKPVSELLDRKVEVVGPEAPLADALYHLGNRQHVVPVVEDGRLLGAISSLSILRAVEGQTK